MILRSLLIEDEKKPKVHKFHDNVDAYDSTQTDDGIKDGDVLVTDRAVGILVSAWPAVVAGDPFEGDFEGARLVLHLTKDGEADWPTIDDGKYKASYELAKSLPEYSKFKKKYPEVDVRKRAKEHKPQSRGEY